MNSLKLLLPFSFIFLSFQMLFAQSPIEKYEQESIYLTTGGFVKGGVKHSAIFSYRGMKKAMKGSLPARAEYQRFSEKRKWAIGLSLIGLTSVIAAIGVEDNIELRRGLLLGGLGATFASVPISTSSTNHLQKAAWLYNRDLLLPEKQKK